VQRARHRERHRTGPDRATSREDAEERLRRRRSDGEHAIGRQHSPDPHGLGMQDVSGSVRAECGNDFGFRHASRERNLARRIDLSFHEPCRVGGKTLACGIRGFLVETSYLIVD
jgi:hypothetical protein